MEDKAMDVSKVEQVVGRTMPWSDDARKKRDAERAEERRLTALENAIRFADATAASRTILGLLESAAAIERYLRTGETPAKKETI